MNQIEDLLVSEVARLLDCSSDKVRDLERRGVLRARRTGGGVRVFSRAEVCALRTKQNAAVLPDDNGGTKVRRSTSGS
jgi:excisionase family DNA binding protein